MTSAFTYPKLHNAMWPGLVGKGAGAEPPIALETMLRLTADTEVGGERFEGVDLFLALPHTDIESTPAEIERLAANVASKNLAVGSLVAPVWPAAGGGSAMGDESERARFLQQVEKACRIGQILRETGVRPYGVIRIDSAASPAEWVRDPATATRHIADTFRHAADIAERYAERLAAEGEICWAGMHSWRHMLDLLNQVNRPGVLGFQADMAHTLLYALGYNAPEDRLVPEDYDWRDPQALHSALQTITDKLRPWTIDFHVAQNDGTVKGSGSHDKTGHHCLPNDPRGKLDIVEVAGLWLRDAHGEPLKHLRHICWDGCMFPNATMEDPATWRGILAVMLAVRAAHGWRE